MKPTDMTDHQLLDAWRAGDRDAGEELFIRHKTAVTNLFRRNVRDRKQILDLVQKTFLAVLENRADREVTGSVRGWLLGVAFYTMTRFFRDERRPLELGADEWIASLESVEPDPVYLLELSDEQRLLMKALRRLDFKYQVLFELNYWEKISCDEIAGILGLPKGTVRSRLQLGRSALQKQLAELADSPELLTTTTMSLSAWQQGIRDFIAGAQGVDRSAGPRDATGTACP